MTGPTRDPDVAGLLRMARRGEFLLPVSRSPSLVDLAAAVLRFCGVPGRLTAGARRMAAEVGAPHHLVVVLADGLGQTAVEALPPGSFLRSHQVQTLRTVFPSSTATALTSMSTGAWPAQHGVTGWWTHLPDLGGPAALLPYAAAPPPGGEARSLAGNLPPESAFPVTPPLPSPRVDAAALLPKDIAGSVYSRSFAPGRPRLPYRSLAEAVDLAARRVAATSSGSYTYVYTPEPDESAHRYGSGHARTRFAVQELDGVLARLRAALPPSARLVVTGDHGVLDVGAYEHHALTPADGVWDLLEAPPSGDARALYFRVAPDRRDTFVERFRDDWGEWFLLLPVEAAIDLRLFGPRPPEPGVRQRLGDYLAIARGPAVMEFLPRDGRPDTVIAAHHSGLTPEEMLVPLVVS